MVFYQSITGMASLVGVLLPMGTVTTVLRFIARYRQKNGYGTDDILLIFAWMCFVSLSALAIYGMADGFVATTTPKDPTVFANIIPVTIRVYWVADMLSTLGLGFIRLSALFFYRRLFITGNKWNRFGIVTFAAIVIVILWMIAFVILQVSACGSHVEWEFSTQGGFCPVLNPWILSTVISSFILDLLILIIPIPKVWALHTTAARKLSILVVFLFAIAGTAGSCTRMVLISNELTVGRAAISKDPFLANTTLLYFMLLEAGICLAAVSLPSLWYFISHTTPERVLRSLRSLVSLRSAHTTDSREFYTGRKGSDPASQVDEDKSVETSDSPLPTKRDEYETTVEERSDRE